MSQRSAFKQYSIFIIQVWIIVSLVYLMKFWKGTTSQRRTKFTCEKQKIHILHESEHFQIINDLILSDQSPDIRDVSVLVQGDISRLHHIPGLAETWRGPVEAVIYHSDSSKFHHVVSLISQLRSCFLAVSNHVTWHFVTPTDVIDPMRECPDMENVPLLPSCDDCSSDKAKCENFLAELRSDVKDTGGNPDRWFPVNVLRNVARNNTKTAMHLTLDIDLTVSENAREMFLKYAEDKGLFDKSPPDKIVYALPAFEYQSKSDPLPRNMNQLLYQYYASMSTRIFHDWCTSCYHITQYDKWFDSSRVMAQLNKDDVTISHYVTWRSPFEPYVIAHNGIPLFPEEFRGYGYNKISQSYVTAVEGYKFAILANVFVVHDGWKSQTKGEKELQLKHNTRLWEDFKKKLGKKF